MLSIPEYVSPEPLIQWQETKSCVAGHGSFFRAFIDLSVVTPGELYV